MRRSVLHRASLTLLTASLAVACTAKTPPPEAPSASASPTTPKPSDLVPGASVSVSRGGRVWPARVVRPVASDRYLVHYEGYGPEWDEVVGLDRIAIPAPVKDYRVGEKVIVTVQGRQALAGVVAQIGPELWRVHYDGYGPEVSENVGPERLRRPFVGTAPHPVGEAVGVDVAGRVVPAKIVAVLASDRWLARLDGYGAQYDQEVGADRLKPAPAAALPPAPAAAVVAPPAASEPADKGKGDKGKGKADKGKADKGKPTKPPEPPAPVVATGPLQVGEVVLVSQRGGTFAAATISGPGAAPNAFRIHYDGPGASSDEDVTADRLQRAPSPLKGVKYQPNQPVFIEWHGVFVAGKVLKENGDSVYKVRFEHFGPESDELVQVKRLRPRP